jgi:Protein of unknown function (DUF3025)
MNARFDLAWLEREPYRHFAPQLIESLRRHAAWPPPEAYDALAGSVPQAREGALPRFVTQSRDALRQMGGYEQHVAKLRAVPTRPRNWHDFFNMSVWAHFPQLRWALNALHVDAEVGPKDPRNGRAPAQNLAATFDESGALVVSTSRSLLEELRALRFKRVFWERREEWLDTTQVWIVGHGTLESLLTPHPGLAVKSFLLHVPSLPDFENADAFRFQLDAAAAARVAGFRSAHTVLDPVPVLGIPGYWDNDLPEFYDDTQHFRFERRAPRPAPYAEPEVAEGSRF